MSWRTVIISNRAKLDLQLGHMVVRSSEIKTKIYIKEMAVLILESTAISITAALINELTKNKVKIIFCDEKRDPLAELIPYYASHDTSAKIMEQVNWDDINKKIIWTEIVKQKILMQSQLLMNNGIEEYKLLLQYMDEVQLGDTSNREGHAAKVYFNSLFGKDFTRGKDGGINASLNYGYSILLSIISREIHANGYMTQLGIFHKGKTNPFNLSSDLIEPWRPLVDSYVFMKQPSSLDNKTKLDIVSLFSEKIFINGKKHTILNAIKIYTKSVFDALNYNDVSKLRFYSNGE